jgi:hypothetical protein
MGRGYLSLADVRDDPERCWPVAVRYGTAKGSQEALAVTIQWMRLVESTRSSHGRL